MKPRLAAAALAVGLAFSMPGHADNSSARIEQFGERNNASTSQLNSPGSFAGVSQSGSDNGSFGGLDPVQQFNATDSSGQVTQAGNHNIGFIGQSSQLGSNALVSQTGSNNTGTVQQFSGADNFGWVFQGGGACLDRNCNSTLSGGPATNNQAAVNQFNGSHHTAITVQHDGPNNNASINQIVGNNNFGLIVQQGSDNNGSIQQGGSWCTSEGCSDFGASNGSSASLFQTGMLQQARVGQFGQAFANAGQSGMFNDLDILQVGVGNQAFASQHGTAAVFADRNVGKIDQLGSSHFAQLAQSGALNNAVIRQR